MELLSTVESCFVVIASGEQTVVLSMVATVTAAAAGRQ